MPASYCTPRALVKPHVVRRLVNAVMRMFSCCHDPLPCFAHNPLLLVLRRLEESMPGKYPGERPITLDLEIRLKEWTLWLNLALDRARSYSRRAVCSRSRWRAPFR